MIPRLLQRPARPARTLARGRFLEHPPPSGSYTRWYAQDSKDNEGGFCHEEWPSHKNPSPYEVLNLRHGSIDQAQLKKEYFKAAKIYHPDMTSSRVLLDHKGATLSQKRKDERFKMLTDAYHLLRDSRKKALYDHHRIGWLDSHSFISDPFRHRTTRPDAAYTAQHAPKWDDYNYWSAGTWEDYQNVKDMNDPALKQEKMKILAALVAIMIVSASVQGWLILENVERDVLARRKMHESCESDLAVSYSNHGLDDSKISRIRRFLWFRTFGLYVEKEKLDTSAKENDKLVEEVLSYKAL